MIRLLAKWLCLIASVPGAAMAQGRYRPVPVQPQTGPPCGHYGTRPCETSPDSVQIPPGATADEVFEMGNRAFAQRQYGVSVVYMKRAAEMGHTRAQAAFGLDYVHGHGVPQDLNQAIFWLTKAAEKGHRVAQGELGDLYEDGDGIPANYPKAFHYHQLSAQQGWWQGENRLGFDYEFGYGTPHNRALAIQWLRRAANDGNDSVSDSVATALSRPGAPARFRSLEELGAFASRAEGRAPQGSGNCPANTFATSPGDIVVFCQNNPGCPYTSRVFGPATCGGR